MFVPKGRYAFESFGFPPRHWGAGNSIPPTPNVARPDPAPPQCDPVPPPVVLCNGRELGRWTMQVVKRNCPTLYALAPLAPPPCCLNPRLRTRWDGGQKGGWVDSFLPIPSPLPSVVGTATSGVWVGWEGVKSIATPASWKNKNNFMPGTPRRPLLRRGRGRWNQSIILLSSALYALPAILSTHQPAPKVCAVNGSG